MACGCKKNKTTKTSKIIQPSSQTLSVESTGSTKKSREDLIRELKRRLNG